MSYKELKTKQDDNKDILNKVSNIDKAVNNVKKYLSEASTNLQEVIEAKSDLFDKDEETSLETLNTLVANTLTDWKDIEVLP